jgi:Domain of unknown function (DUF2017)
MPFSGGLRERIYCILCFSLGHVVASSSEMRFFLTEEEWVMDALNPAEWHFLQVLPDTAAGKSGPSRLRERLTPSPLSDDSLAGEDTLELSEDWKELIIPELEEGFREARAVVQRDLDQVEVLSLSEWMEDLEEDSTPDLPLEMRRVRVPLEHTEAWYSALNEARLLLHEEHGIAGMSDRLETTARDEPLPDDLLLLLAQYELYSVVQSILVENVMTP